MTTKSKPDGCPDICWLDDASYAKAIWNLRVQLMQVMEPLEAYGQKFYVDEAINQIIKLSEDFGLRVRGIDKQIAVEIIRKGKGV